MEQMRTFQGAPLAEATRYTDPAAAAGRAASLDRWWTGLLAMAGMDPIAGAERAANWVELITPQMRQAFYLGYSEDGRRQSMIPTLYGTFPSQQAFEEFMGVGTLSSKGWDFEKTGRVQREDRQKGWLKRFTHVEFAKGTWVQRKLIDDNQTGIAFNDARGLGDSAWRKREKGAASVFNNAFTDSGVNDDGLPIAGPDGVGLCSTAHPLAAGNSATQSNEGTLPLTKDNLGITRRLHQKWTDDQGDLMNVMPNELLVPPELEDVAEVIGGSQLDPDSANNAINPQRGRFNTITWHYLTDANAWFTMDSSRRARSLRWYDRIPLEYGPDDYDRDTHQIGFDAYMRYSYGWVDPSFIYGQNPA